MSDLRTAAQQALEALGKWSSGRDIDAVQLNDLIATLESALEQPEQATGKESLQVGQEEPEGGWQSAPSPQVTQRIADMPMSEYRRGVNDGFKLGLREGRIKAEDEMREQTVQEPVAWACFKNGELQTELIGTEADVDFWCASDELDMEGMVKGALYTHPPRRETEPAAFDALVAISLLTHLGGEVAEYADVVEAVRRLHALNGELLEALRWIDRRCPKRLMDQELHKIHQEAAHDAGACARAAIARAEGNT